LAPEAIRRLAQTWRNSSLLLLDEPASGLSIDQRVRLSEILLEIATRTTVVLVEHDLEMIKRTVSKVFVLIDGRLEFEGGPGNSANRRSSARNSWGLSPSAACSEGNHDCS